MNGPAKISDVLDRAADLIEPEGAWTQIQAALDKYGNQCGWDDAVCFCAFGAVRMAGGDAYPQAMSFANNLVRGGLIGFNDAPERTQPEVVSKLRETAALAREQGK